MISSLLTILDAVWNIIRDSCVFDYSISRCYNNLSIGKIEIVRNETLFRVFCTIADSESFTNCLEIMLFCFENQIIFKTRVRKSKKMLVYKSYRISRFTPDNTVLIYLIKSCVSNRSDYIKDRPKMLSCGSHVSNKTTCRRKSTFVWSVTLLSCWCHSYNYNSLRRLVEYSKRGK